MYACDVLLQCMMIMSDEYGDDDVRWWGCMIVLYDDDVGVWCITVMYADSVWWR